MRRNHIPPKVVVGLYNFHEVYFTNTFRLDFLQVAIDVSGNGKLSLPPYRDGTPTQFHTITIFLFSYDTGKNFTITNATTGPQNASIGDIMFQEPGSTVKHVNWVWPDCLVGNGAPKDNSSARGAYNVSHSSQLSSVSSLTGSDINTPVRRLAPRFYEIKETFDLN